MKKKPKPKLGRKLKGSHPKDSHLNMRCDKMLHVHLDEAIRMLRQTGMIKKCSQADAVLHSLLYYNKYLGTIPIKFPEL